MVWALPVQVSWAVLSAIWNITGTLLISQGLQALGLTASWTTAVVMLVLTAALMWTVERLPFRVDSCQSLKRKQISYTDISCGQAKVQAGCDYTT